MTRWFIPNPASAAPNVLAAQVVPPGVGTLTRKEAVAQRMKEAFFPAFEQPAFFNCAREGLLQMAVEWFADKKIAIVVNGPMSQEWYDIADDCRAHATIFDTAYGADVDLNAFELFLRREEYDVLLLTATDVYTGTRIPLEEMCEISKRIDPDAMIVADISGEIFCANHSGYEERADVLLCGSEMAMGLPPGLGMAVLDERAHARVLAHNIMNGRYFNYVRYSVSQSPSALDAPNYPLLNALEEQMESVMEEGMPDRVKRMTETRALLYEWIDAKGFTYLTAPGSRALNSTAIVLPNEFTAAGLEAYAARYGVSVMPGTHDMTKNSLILYHGNDASVEDIKVLIRVMDRFLSDYDTRRRKSPQTQTQKV
jgi:aspartate aminotransferase-like enzyme